MARVPHPSAVGISFHINLFQPRYLLIRHDSVHSISASCAIDAVDIAQNRNHVS
jgi:hypothetical protein